MLHRFVRIIKTVKFYGGENMDSISSIGSVRPFSQIQSDSVNIDSVRDTEIGTSPLTEFDGKYEWSADGKTEFAPEVTIQESREIASARESQSRYLEGNRRSEILHSQDPKKSESLKVFSVKSGADSDGSFVKDFGKAFIEKAQHNEARKEDLKVKMSQAKSVQETIQVQALSYDHYNEISQMNGLVKRVATIVQDTLKAQ